MFARIWVIFSSTINLNIGFQENQLILYPDNEIINSYFWYMARK